ncbi:MAG: uL15 family ribosomal protein [Candidatus Anstonellales archaeon]
MRTPKKKKAFLGRRRFGRGNVKNRRGAGNRGGRGKAGKRKHKFFWFLKHAPEELYSKGFFREKRKRPNTINLFEIQNMADKGKLKKEGNAYYFEFKGKVLGSGVLSCPVNVKAVSFTKKAEEAITRSGGKAERF